MCVYAESKRNKQPKKTPAQMQALRKPENKLKT